MQELPAISQHKIVGADACIRPLRFQEVLMSVLLEFCLTKSLTIYIYI